MSSTSRPTESKRAVSRVIALEEHFVTPAFMAGPGREMLKMLEASSRFVLQMASSELLERLLDIGDERVSQMDAAGIDMQVLSLARGLDGVQDDADAIGLARDSNDLLAEAVKRHPARFSGLAALPVLMPEEAADELERTVKDHGFKGTMIHGHSRGRYLDDRFFSPVLARAEELGVPIYLHPTRPPEPVVKASYVGNYPQEVAALLAVSGWGWHIETALHLLRVILGGVFDEHPKLQMIVGHLGEALPFMMPRIERQFQRDLTKLDRPLGAYLRENVHYTFGGFNYTSSFINLFLEVGAERIMFAADYPYGSMVEGRTFLDQLPVSPRDRERIAHQNAEKLLSL